MKGNIDISNYEEWFMDYLDGTLNQLEMKTLEAFLKVNPALQAELDSFEALTLEPVHMNLTASEKAQLKRPEIEDERIIAILEDNVGIPSDLSPSDSEQLEQYARTRFVANPQILFPDHSILKKNEGLIIPLWFKVSAIAASVLISFFLLTPESEVPIYAQRSKEIIHWDSLSDFLESTPYSSDSSVRNQITRFSQETAATDHVKEITQSPLPTGPIAQKEELPTPDSYVPIQEEHTADPLFTELPVDEAPPITLEEPHLAAVELAQVPSPKHSPVSKSLSEDRPVTTALDLLKKVTVDSEVLAIQEVNEEDPYIHGSLTLGSFSLSIKRKRR